MRTRLLIPLLTLPLLGAGLGAPLAGMRGVGIVAVVGVVAAATIAAILWTVIPWASRVDSFAQRLRSDLPSDFRDSGTTLLELERSLPAAISRIQSERAERQREVATLSAVLDSMAEGVWITDAQGTVVRHNRALAEMLSLARPIVGQRPLDLLRKSELHEAVMAACAENALAKLELSLEGNRTLAVRVAPMGGSLPGSSAVFRDVTELRHLEKVRQDFVANVSHELRTPITAILGYAETLRGGALADARHAPMMVEIIHRQSERLSQLVTDLLDLSRLEARQLRLRPEPVELAAAASRAAEVVLPHAERKQIRIDLAVPAGVQAMGDVHALEQVLINLLDNAIKYTPVGGIVEVTGKPEDGICSLSVHDTGIGIEAKHLPRLFERFYRVDRGRSRDMGGTGLGLSIVKHLMAAMRGDIHVVSEPGVGSTFTATLPRVSG